MNFYPIPTLFRGLDIFIVTPSNTQFWGRCVRILLLSLLGLTRHSLTRKTLLRKIRTVWKNEKFTPNFRTMIPFYLDHVPSGSSTRPFVHYAQLHLLDREFRKFDFGSPEKNIEHYGVSIPPKHDLSKVKVSNSTIFTLCA